MKIQMLSQLSDGINFSFLGVFQQRFYVWIHLLSLFLSPPLIADTLIISCPHKEIPFTVEVAQTSEEEQKGLMFREELDPNAGMIFLYPTPRPVAMWMKNTLLPLDMIFGDENGTILAIYEDTMPHSLQSIGPVENTAQVLEINAGMVRKHEITPDCTLKLSNALLP